MNTRLTRVSLLVVVILTMAAVSLVSAQGNPVRRPTISNDLQADFQHYAPAALTVEERQAILGQAALEHAGAAALTAEQRQADIQHYAPAALTLEERKAIFQDPGFVPVFTSAEETVLGPALSVQERQAIRQHLGPAALTHEERQAILEYTR